MGKKPASLLAVSLGKAFNGIGCLWLYLRVVRLVVLHCTLYQSACVKYTEHLLKDTLNILHKCLAPICLWAKFMDRNCGAKML